MRTAGFDSSYGQVSAKRPMGLCLRVLVVLSEDVPIAESGECAGENWRETDASRHWSSSGSVPRNLSRTSTFMRFQITR